MLIDKDKITELSQVQFITLQMQHLWMKNYSYIVLNLQKKEALVVDPAWEIKKIEKSLENFDLTDILLTHAHPDHTHLVTPLVKKYECSVWMSREEINHSEFKCPGLIPVEKDMPFECSGISIFPFLTPGHTPGSMCYLISNNLFTGDTLFSEGCGACFGTEGNPHHLYGSLQYLKRHLPKNTHIFPGHSFGVSPGKTFEALFGSNIYLSFENEEQFVAFRMRKGQKNSFNFQWGK
jgi:hydroxyacylglutathione hydrolase